MSQNVRCKLNFYGITKLTPNENFMLDNIDKYLSNSTETTEIASITMKHALEVTLVIQMVSSAIWADNAGWEKFNYLRAQNLNDNEEFQYNYRKVYYFIVEKQIVGEKSVRLTLRMDVLNTFKFNSDYTLSPLTLVRREHKDRFIKANISFQTKWIASINRFPEGLSPQLYNLPQLKEIIQDNITGTAPNWYLIYKNSLENSEDTNNVVDCFLASDVELAVSYLPLAPTISPSDLEMGKFYYFYAYSCPSLMATEAYTGTSFAPYIDNNGMIRVTKINNTQMLVESFAYMATSVVTPPYDNDPVQSNSSWIVSSLTATAGEKYYVSTVRNDLRRDAYNASIEKEISLNPVNKYTKKYEDVNKTDSRLIKVIKLPYPPTKGFTISGSNINFDANKWEFDDNEELLKLNPNYHDYFINDNLKIHLPYVYNGIDISTSSSFGSLNALRTYVDPKNYHSEFYKIKYVYDSFEKVIPLEYVNEDNFFTDAEYKVEFAMTRTINSKFMFTFDILFSLADEDYPKTLVVQRNNEEVLYSSPYINYIRSGFNYDVKAKNQQIGMSWFTTALGIIGGGLNVAFGSKTLGIGMIASSVASLGNAINTTINAERNFERNLQMLKMQSNAVSGADDVDLMSIYASNKLCRYIYRPSTVMSKLIDDMFYFLGYATSEYKIPVINSRAWFNFIQADIRIEKMMNGIPSYAIEEITNRFAGGVFIMHDPNNNGTPDFGFTHENWEMSIINRNN